MNIALISPKSNFLGHNKELQKLWLKSDYISTYRKEWSGCTASLALIAALTPIKHNTDIYDENIESINFSHEYDLVGISCMTQQATRAYQIANKFRNMGIKVVMGGIHPSTIPEESINYADSIVIGEAENVWKEILNDFEKHQLQDFYKSNTPVNLSDSPVPRYDLLNGKDYLVHWVQTSRGCPHDCVFCAASKIYGYKYRNKPVEHVIEESVCRVEKDRPHQTDGYRHGDHGHHPDGPVKGFCGKLSIEEHGRGHTDNQLKNNGYNGKIEHIEDAAQPSFLPPDIHVVGKSDKLG